MTDLTLAAHSAFVMWIMNAFAMSMPTEKLILVQSAFSFRAVSLGHTCCDAGACPILSIYDVSGLGNPSDIEVLGIFFYVIEE